MDDFYNDSLISEAVLENLKSSDRELLAKLKKRRLHVRDLAFELFEEGDLLFDGPLSERSSERVALLTEHEALRSGESAADPLFEDGAQELCDILSVSALCRDLAEQGTPEVLLPRKPEGSRICYFRNAYTDLAFLSFAKVLPDSSADYTHDFASACEGVYNGKYDYCILPCSSYFDGALTGFIGFIHKYELSISLSCRVPTSDGGFMSFYLLSGERTCLEGANRMALTAVTGEEYLLWELLCSARLFGARCIECTSLPQRFFEKKAYFVELDTEGADIKALALYVRLVLPEGNITGIYPHIS